VRAPASLPPAAQPAAPAPGTGDWKTF